MKRSAYGALCATVVLAAASLAGCAQVSAFEQAAPSLLDDVAALKADATKSQNDGAKLSADAKADLLAVPGDLAALAADATQTQADFNKLQADIAAAKAAGQPVPAAATAADAKRPG